MGLFCCAIGALMALACSIYVECEPGEKKSVTKQKKARAKTLGFAAGSTTCMCLGTLIFIGIAFSSMSFTDTYIPKTGLSNLFALWVTGFLLMIGGSGMAGVRLATVKQKVEW